MTLLKCDKARRQRGLVWEAVLIVFKGTFKMFLVILIKVGILYRKIRWAMLNLEETLQNKNNPLASAKGEILYRRNQVKENWGRLSL